MNKIFDPFDHFGFLAHRVARLLNVRMQPKLKKAGFDFPPSCLGILANLWSKDGVSQSRLGYSLVKTKSSINKMLEALINDGLIEKRIDPQDKRNKLIFLTNKGKEFQRIIENGADDLNSSLLQIHTKEEIAITKKVLKSFYFNLMNKISNDQ